MTRVPDEGSYQLSFEQDFVDITTEPSGIQRVSTDREYILEIQGIIEEVDYNFDDYYADIRIKIPGPLYQDLTRRFSEDGRRAWEQKVQELVLSRDQYESAYYSALEREKTLIDMYKKKVRHWKKKYRKLRGRT